MGVTDGQKNRPSDKYRSYTAPEIMFLFLTNFLSYLLELNECWDRIEGVDDLEVGDLGTAGGTVSYTENFQGALKFPIPYLSSLLGKNFNLCNGI